jgi:hypothetical protein
MSHLSLEDYEDLLNIPLCESPKVKEKPSFVPSLRLSTPSQSSDTNEFHPKPPRNLSNLQQVLLRKKARNFIESKQIQNFESFEASSNQNNFSVDEILAKARLECEKPKVTRYFDAKLMMKIKETEKKIQKKRLKAISEGFFQQEQDDPCNMKNLE